MAPVEKDGIAGYGYDKEKCAADGYNLMLIKSQKSGDKPYYEAQGDFIFEKFESIPKLKILASNPFLQGKDENEIKAVDVTMLAGLHNFKRYSRGFKTYSRWFVEQNFEDGVTVPAVERIYSLIWNDDILAGKKCVMNWYNDDDSLAFSKETFEYYSAKDAAKVLKDIRETRILYLQNPEFEYVNPTTKQYIAMLFEHYKGQVSDYILSGSQAFENAINNEESTQINAILNAVLDGRTIKDRILEQIQGGYG